MQDNPAVVFFGEFNGGVSQQQSASRASATAFEVGDELGVYVALDGQQFVSANNRLDNGRFKVASDGNIKGDPAVYYPDPKAEVTLYAYYPYISTMNNATKWSFSVQADQSSGENVKKSDLCYARQSVLPSAEAQRLLFTHKNGRLVLNFTNTTPSAIASVKLLDVRRASTFNLQDGSNITDATVDKGGVSLVAAVNTQAIVPAQGFAVDRPLLEVVLTNGDRYIFKPQSQIAVDQGTQTTLLLSLDDNNTISLTAAPETEPWVSEATSAGLSGAVRNNFTLYWAFPGIGYQDAARAELIVAQNENEIEHTITATNFKSLSVADPLMCTYSFDFEVDPLHLGYSYLIKSISFYDNSGDLIQQCQALLAATVYKQGAYTIGVEQDNILSVIGGKVNSYSEVFGLGTIGGGVANQFSLQLFEPQAAGYDYTKLSRVRITADGVVYVFDGIVFTSNSNILIALTDPFTFDGTSRPAGYPYTIQRVELLDSGDNVLGGVGVGVFEADIMVTRPGSISLQLFHGKALELVQSAAITVFGSVSATDAPIFTGTVKTSPVELVYTLSNGTPVGGKEATSVTRADITVLTSDGQSSVVSLSPYAMVGTPLAAYSSRALNIAQGSGWPAKTRFPYRITQVALFDKDGVPIVMTTPLASPFEVRHSGKVTLSVMKYN